MFNDFGSQSAPRDTMTTQEIFKQAEAMEVPGINYFIRIRGYNSSRGVWNKFKDIDFNEDKYPLINICQENDVVGKLATSLADSVQFPRSSAYAHFLGCVSAAMLGRFSMEYFDSKQPTNLYVVISQPPSAGKSSINDAAITPLAEMYDEANERRKVERVKVLAKIGALKAQMKSEEVSQTVKEQNMQELQDLKDKADALNPMTFPVSDTTPEGLAKINHSQGNFAIISDEATAINSLLGLTYGDSNKKSNSELVLKAWDHGRVSITRSNQENNIQFTALGTISVIAQDETIDSIMMAGERGVGVSERFLLVREKTFLGNRTFIDENGELTYKPVDKKLKEKYRNMIRSIMSETDVTLSFEKKAIAYVMTVRQEVEKKLGDGGEYSHTMLRGAMGKMDKQVFRLAAILHTIRHWESGERGKIVELDTVEEAVEIYRQLSQTYISAASSAGHAGEDAELKVLDEAIVKRAPSVKGQFKVSQIVEAVRRVKPFASQVGTAKKIRNVLLPRLQEMGRIAIVDDNVYVHPELAGFK